MHQKATNDRSATVAHPLIALSDYTLAPHGSGCGIKQFSFSLWEGDVCAVKATHSDDATTLLKALATLILPLKGTLHHAGKIRNLNDYHDLLEFKRCIGYIAPDCALISNLTLRQNLMLRRYYFENSLSDRLDDQTLALCHAFKIQNKLDRRPTVLNTQEVQAAVVIREITKNPQVLLLNLPENLIGHTGFEMLEQMFTEWIAKRLPVVLISHDRPLLKRFANRMILIDSGSLSEVTVQLQPTDTEAGSDLFKSL